MGIVDEPAVVALGCLIATKGYIVVLLGFSLSHNAVLAFPLGDNRGCDALCEVSLRELITGIHEGREDAGDREVLTPLLSFLRRSLLFLVFSLSFRGCLLREQTARDRLSNYDLP